MDTVLSFFASSRKAVVVALGTLVTLLTVYHQIPFLPSQPVVASVLAAVTTLVTWLTPNATK